MSLNPFSRRGNALMLTTLILTLVVTGMLLLTDTMIGRQKMDDLSRMSSRAQDAANNVAEALSDRIKSKESKLMTDLTQGGDNDLDDWLSRGFVGRSADVANVRGIWINNCLVYWRLEPVVSYDRTVSDRNGNGMVDDTDVVADEGQKYMVNRSLDVTTAAATTSARSGAMNDNPGLLFFELTIDAFVMPPNGDMNGNPLRAAVDPTPNLADLSPLHAQLKKRILVKNDSLFRYVIFYNAQGRTGDIEFMQSPDISIVGAVHTNGAAYLGYTVGNLVFGTEDPQTAPLPDPSLPPLKPISFTAIDGLFSMRKEELYRAGQFKPEDVPITDPVINDTATTRRNQNPPYLNSAVLQYNEFTIAGELIYIPALAGTPADNFSVDRDSRPTSPDIKDGLRGYDTRLVRDKANRDAKVKDLTKQGGIVNYRPLEPFRLVPPQTPLLGRSPNFSVNTGVNNPGRFATDMLYFQLRTGTDIQPDQATAVLPTRNPLLEARAVPILNPPSIIMGAPPISDLFSNLATYIIPPIPLPIPANSPIPNFYIQNPLGLRKTVTPGVGITILERGTQLPANWPSFSQPGGRPGAVTWDPPSLLAFAGYAGNPSHLVIDYCQWMRTNYVVYFGVNDAGNALVDITDQFFSVPVGTTNLNAMLAREDVFKDRRESRWRQSTVDQYTAGGAANYDATMVNALTLNMAAICQFIRDTPLNTLDPDGTPAMASTRFNGTIYAGRTPRYSGAAQSTRLGTLPGQMPTYQMEGSYDPLAPLGINQTWPTGNLPGQLTAEGQLTTLPIGLTDNLLAGAAPLYPVVGNSGTASMNGYPGHPMTTFGSSTNAWAVYPLMKRVRIANATAIDWNGRLPSGRATGLTIYTPNVCYLQGSFNTQLDASSHYPLCALYCDGLVALSNAWNDAAVNALTGTGNQIYTNATQTIHRLCLVIHNSPTDLANINGGPLGVWSPGGSGGVHNVVKFLENWRGIDWAFIGSLVVLDRARYTRGYLGNQDVYEPPKRRYCFNADLLTELPPFPDVVNDVFIW